MRYGSVCSGIEAATVAWHSLGWVPSFFSEIEKFPRDVLAHHYPDVPLHGDFTTIGENQYGSIDLLVGGTPCQSFSRADGFNAIATASISYGLPGNWIGRKPENGGNQVEPFVELSPCQTTIDRHAVASPMAVRRLTPTECERLQGFPDGYTNIKDKCPDGPRYKALGNSMAVPVMRWIGERIQEVDKI